MNLTSLTFLLFCIITLFFYFIVPKKIQWYVLLIASTIFIFYGNLTKFTFLEVLLVLLASYFGARKIDSEKGKKRTYYLLGSIGVILGILFLLKYTNLLLVTFNHLFNLFKVKYKFKLITRNSPIGISYYSLIMIGYLIDVYRGGCKAEKNIFKVALFMYYFPIIPSGPFTRYNDMKKELYEPHKFNYDALCSGLVRCLWGLFKIFVISQRISIFVNTVYGDLVTYNGFFTVIAALLFTLQLYTNFSGSIDIIMGVSEIMGINLPENFNAPFLSRTITELWRNWHITLGAWLKDYIFYPLLKSNFMQSLNKKYRKKIGRKKAKKIPLYLSMLIMWILIGVWHGGTYNFIIATGLLQFIYIFLEDVLAPVMDKINRKLKINPYRKTYRLFQMIRTYVLFSFSLIFFRAPSIKKAIDIIKSIFVWNPWVLTDNSTLFKAGLNIHNFRVLIIAIIVLFIIEKRIKKGNVRKQLFRQNIVVRWALIYMLILSIIVFGCYGVGFDPASFIYRQF